MRNGKSVYIAISSDILHQGHLNVLEVGAKLGEVTVGLLTDQAIATYKRLPIVDFESRRALFSSLRNVSQVVPQETLSYADNIRRLRPDYVVHGDDWTQGVQAMVRTEVINLLAEYGGELVEIPATKGVSGSDLERALRPLMNTGEIRRSKLRRLLALKPYLRAIEASNGLSALIVENVKATDPQTVEVREFDAMWVSSLCDSTFKGKPDIELVDLTSRLRTIEEIMEVSTKPIIVDGDTGGREAHFGYTVRTLERTGVSAVIIEDKTGLKQNSLFGTDAVQTLDDPAAFANKINIGKQSQSTRDFMIIARLESLIAGAGVDDALRRAKIYLAGGADGITPATPMAKRSASSCGGSASSPPRPRWRWSRPPTTSSTRRNSPTGGPTSSSTPTTCCAAPTRQCWRPPGGSSTAGAARKSTTRSCPSRTS